MYDLSQQQRKAEARIRQQKIKVLGLREAVDAAEDTAVKATLQDEYNKAALKLQRYNQAYNSFCEDNNLHKLNDRITVAKWTRSEAAKATAAARKAQQ